MEKLIKDCKRVLGKNKYSIPILTMVLYLSIALGITVMMKSIVGTSKEEASIATNAAEASFYNGKYDAAIAEYTKLQEKEEWPMWNVKIAEIYSVKGEFVKSNEILGEVYETRNKIIDTKKDEKNTLEDKDEELTNYIVFTAFVNGESKKALVYGQLFLRDHPNDKNLLRTMFTVYMANGDKDKAKEIVDNYPSDDETASDLAILARMYILVDDFDKGFSILKEAWYKDKSEIKIFDVIAQIADYNKVDLLDKLSKLEKKEPDELAYKIWKAKLYSMSKEYSDKCEELVSNLEKEDVGNKNLMLIKASMYQSQGETEKSQEVLKEIIDDEPDSFIGYHAAAWQAYNNSRYDEAFKNAQKSILMNKDYPDNYGFLIPEIMVKQGKNEGAEPYFRTALYKEPFNYNIIVKIAEYYGNTLKDTTKALHYYDLASKVKPNDAEIYYNMALIKINNQREDEAIELLKKSISINNKIPKYHRALGTVYLNKEKSEEAIKEIRNAYAIDKNDILTLNNAGCYYIAIERDVDRGMINLKAAYDGINEKTSAEDKQTIIDNYNRVKNLSDAYNKRNGATLIVPDLRLFY